MNGRFERISSDFCSQPSSGPEESMVDLPCKGEIQIMQFFETFSLAHTLTYPSEHKQEACAVTACRPSISGRTHRNGGVGHRPEMLGSVIVLLCVNRNILRSPDSTNLLDSFVVEAILQSRMSNSWDGIPFSNQDSYMPLRIPSAAFFLMLLLARQPFTSASASASVQKSTTGRFSRISSLYQGQEEDSEVIGLSVRSVADITPTDHADAVNQTASDPGTPPSISPPEERHAFHGESGYLRTSSILLIIIFVIVFFTTGFLSIYIQKHCIGPIRPDSLINHSIPIWQTPQEQQHGVSSHLVSTLPTLVYSKDQGLKEAIGMKAIAFSSECAVCLTPFDDGEELRLLPGCGHSYHKECIDMWFFSHETCPLCRRIIGHKQKADGDPDIHRPPVFETQNLSYIV